MLNILLELNCFIIYCWGNVWEVIRLLWSNCWWPPLCEHRADCYATVTTGAAALAPPWPLPTFCARLLLSSRSTRTRAGSTWNPSQARNTCCSPAWYNSCSHAHWGSIAPPTSSSPFPPNPNVIQTIHCHQTTESDWMTVGEVETLVHQQIVSLQLIEKCLIIHNDDMSTQRSSNISDKQREQWNHSFGWLMTQRIEGFRGWLEEMWRKQCPLVSSSVAATRSPVSQQHHCSLCSDRKDSFMLWRKNFTCIKVINVTPEPLLLCLFKPK